MTLTAHPHPIALQAALDDIITTHGRWRVLLALVALPLRPSRPLPPLGLNDHLRRDIGLEPLPLPSDWVL